MAVKKPPPKVAFGSNKELDKNNSNSNKSKLSQQGANVIAGGGAGGRSAAPVPRSNAGTAQYQPYVQLMKLILSMRPYITSVVNFD